MPKVTCEKLNKIQDDLISKAVALYEKNNIGAFLEALDGIDTFLSVKHQLNCNRKKG